MIGASVRRSVVELCEHKARTTPTEPVLTLVGPRGDSQTINWGEFFRESQRIAQNILAADVGPGGRLAISRDSCVEHFVGTLGGWIAGQLVLPVPPRLKSDQLRDVLAEFQPDIIIDQGGMHKLSATAPPVPETRLSMMPFPRPAMSAILSSGTTGTPKIIYRKLAWQEPSCSPNEFDCLCRRGDVTLVSTPLYGMGFQTFWDSFLWGNHTVVLRRFAPMHWLRAVEEYCVTFARLVPTQMKWIAESKCFATANLTSLRVIHHTAASCPDSVKRTWLTRLSAQGVYESYSSREDIFSTLISGAEWLAHPGSVGKIAGHNVLILGDDLQELPAGEIGRVFLRPHNGKPIMRGGNGNLETARAGKYMSVGDIGWLDSEGYLYLVGRSGEMLITGGQNVFPAHIETQIAACDKVQDCVVLGEDDDDFGQIAAAYVVPNEGARLREIIAFARERLTGVELPRRFYLVRHIPRNESGKVSRRELMSVFKARSPTHVKEN